MTMKKLLGAITVFVIAISLLVINWSEGNSGQRSVGLALRFVDRDGYPLAGVRIYRQPHAKLIGIGDTYGRWQRYVAIDGDDLALTLHKDRDGQQLVAERYYRQPANELREVISLNE